MTLPDPDFVQRALLRDKIHVRPETLARLPTAEAARLRSPLDLARKLLKPLQTAPLAMLDWWRLHPRGHVVIGPVEQGYVLGPQAVGRQTLDCVAWVTAKEVLARDDLAEPLASLFDHLLGCDGQTGGLWLSEGGGRTAAWLEVGGRLQRQFALGYAPQPAARDSRSYLAWGMRTFLARRQEVNVADPGLERLLATTMFDPLFWQRAEDHAASG